MVIDVTLEGWGNSGLTASEQKKEGSCRPAKGKSIIESISCYTAIDLETTGLSPGRDQIIEVAAVRVVNGEIAESFESLINPGVEIDSFITGLTGITNEMLYVAPRLEAVFPKFIEFIGNATIIAHNANFDINFVYDNCDCLGLPSFCNNFIDTMRVSRRLFPNERRHRLTDLADRFGVCDEVKHRALSDAVQAHKCYEYMRAYMKKNCIEPHMLYPIADKRSYAARTIPAATECNRGTAVYGKTFVFTGALSRMQRKDAMQIVANMGGYCDTAVTSNTSFLVLGNGGNRASANGSSKQRRAEQLNSMGAEIIIVSEEAFYEMIDVKG